MRFSEMSYVRPDLDKMKEVCVQTANTIKESNNLDDVLKDYDIYMKAGYSTNNGGSNFTSNSISSGYSSRYTFKVDDGADVAITNTK